MYVDIVAAISLTKSEIYSYSAGNERIFVSDTSFLNEVADPGSSFLVLHPYTIMFIGGLHYEKQKRASHLRFRVDVVEPLASLAYSRLNSPACLY
jgi:hypothetical protein